MNDNYVKNIFKHTNNMLEWCSYYVCKMYVRKARDRLRYTFYSANSHYVYAKVSISQQQIFGLKFSTIINQIIMPACGAWNHYINFFFPSAVHVCSCPLWLPSCPVRFDRRPTRLCKHTLTSRRRLLPIIFVVNDTEKCRQCWWLVVDGGC